MNKRTMSLGPAEWGARALKPGYAVSPAVTLYDPLASTFSPRPNDNAFMVRWTLPPFYRGDTRAIQLQTPCNLVLQANGDLWSSGGQMSRGSPLPRSGIVMGERLNDRSWHVTVMDDRGVPLNQMTTQFEGNLSFNRQLGLPEGRGIGAELTNVVYGPRVEFNQVWSPTSGPQMPPKSWEHARPPHMLGMGFPNQIHSSDRPTHARSQPDWAWQIQNH